MFVILLLYGLRIPTEGEKTSISLLGTQEYKNLIVARQKKSAGGLLVHRRYVFVFVYKKRGVYTPLSVL